MRVWRSEIYTGFSPTVKLTKPGEVVTQHGVTIVGPVNIPSTIPFHASQMYAKNISTMLLNMVKEGKLELNMEDEITRDTMVCRDGEIVNPAMREGASATPAATGSGGEE